MDEKNFRAFVEILRILKSRDSEKSSIKETITDLIDHYDKDFTKEQKAKILKNLASYEKKGRKRTERIEPPRRDYF